MSPPLGGADAVWNRLKLVFDRKAGGEGRRGRSAGKRHGTGQQPVGERGQVEERREQVVDAVRWAWKV